MVIDKYARVLIPNPLHPKLPKLTVTWAYGAVVSMLSYLNTLINTCNKFNSLLVEEILSACQHILKGIVSVTWYMLDRDSRRRKAQLDTLTSTSKCSFQPIPRKLGFHLCAMKEDVLGGGYQVSKLGN